MSLSGFRRWTSCIENLWFPKSQPRAAPVTNLPEPPKPTFTRSIWDIIAWHRWTFISVGGSVVLLYLNFSEYAIGGELGKTSSQTANILGALQLAIKVHELLLVASLVYIARQWINESLLASNRGVVLGLIGAGEMLAAPNFVISNGYLAAIRYGLSGGLSWRSRRSEDTARRREMVFLGAFIFVGCVVSSLAGPASGVLMIPRVDWFFEKELIFPIDDDPLHGTHYPNLLMDTGYAKGEYNLGFGGDPFAGLGFGQVDRLLEYWGFYASRRMLFLEVQNTLTKHTVEDRWGRVAINTTTTWDRPLGGNWTGHTNISTIMRESTLGVITALQNRKNDTSENVHYAAAMKRWSGRKYVAYAGALMVQAECHYRLIESCLPQNHPEWCYSSRSDDTILKSSRDLLLIGQSPTTAARQLILYMTEGPKSGDYPGFITSMEIILFERSMPQSVNNSLPDKTPIVPRLGVIECSISSKIESATITSSEIVFSSDFADFADYQILANGTKESPHPVLFHEHWLDSISVITQNQTAQNRSLTATGHVSFPPRNQSIITNNPTLQLFAKTAITPYMLQEKLLHRGQQWSTVEAAELEITLGGAFASILLYLPPSDSQYALPPGVKLPDTFLPRQKFYDRATNFKIQVYNQGYGYRLSSRTGKLGVVVLLAHAFIALLGSLWQLMRWKVFTAWTTIPEYLALGCGSPTGQPRLRNTGAGISGTRTLQSVMRVQKTNEHLEILALEPAVDNSGDYSDKGLEIGIEEGRRPSMKSPLSDVEASYG